MWMHTLKHLKTRYFQKKRKRQRTAVLDHAKQTDNEQDQKDQVHQETWETRRGPITNTTINTERAKEFWQECFPKRIINLYLLKLIGDKWVNKDRKRGPLDSLEYFSFCVVCMDEQDQATGITQATFYFAWIKEHINQNKLESGLLSHL